MPVLGKTECLSFGLDVLHKQTTDFIEFLANGLYLSAAMRRWNAQPIGLAEAARS